jgi:hypothetical protein
MKIILHDILMTQVEGILQILLFIPYWKKLFIGQASFENSDV